MIVRHLLLRQARSALHPRRTFCVASRTLNIQSDSIDASVNSSLQNIRGLAAVVNSVASEPVEHAQETLDEAEAAKLQSQRVAEDFLEFQRLKQLGSHSGAVVAPHYEPHTLITNPPRPADVTLELLLASQSHLGHNTSLWNPANSRYIFGIREGVHIISLEVTAAHLRRAAKVVSAVAHRAGLILFVGTRAGQERCVVRAAELAGGCHLFERWTPGTITNGLQILARSKLKVVDEFDNEVVGFEDKLRELPPLKPDLVVCLNPTENWPLLHECAQHSIPTIGVIDTDANPTWVTYPIPANDDSLRCIQVIAGVLGRAGEAGRQQRLALASNKGAPASERITYDPAIKLFQETDDGRPANRFREKWRELKDENMLLLAPTREAVRERYALRQRKLDEKRRAQQSASEPIDEGQAAELVGAGTADMAFADEVRARPRHNRGREAKDEHDQYRIR